MAKQKYWNGIIIGIALAVLALFAAKDIAVLGFIANAVTWIVDTLTTQTWMPTSLSGWAYFDYMVVAVIGMAIGIWVESS